jgi:hypothetical protein
MSNLFCVIRGKVLILSIRLYGIETRNKKTARHHGEPFLLVVFSAYLSKKRVTAAPRATIVVIIAGRAIPKPARPTNKKYTINNQVEILLGILIFTSLL